MSEASMQCSDEFLKIGARFEPGAPVTKAWPSATLGPGNMAKRHTVALAAPAAAKLQTGPGA